MSNQTLSQKAKLDLFEMHVKAEIEGDFKTTMATNNKPEPHV